MTQPDNDSETTPGILTITVTGLHFPTDDHDRVELELDFEDMVVKAMREYEASVGGRSYDIGGKTVSAEFQPEDY